MDYLTLKRKMINKKLIEGLNKIAKEGEKYNIAIRNTGAATEMLKTTTFIWINAIHMDYLRGDITEKEFDAKMKKILTKLGKFRSEIKN